MKHPSELINTGHILFHSSMDFWLWCSGLSHCISWAWQIFPSLREISLGPWQEGLIKSLAPIWDPGCKLLNPHWVVPPTHDYHSVSYFTWIHVSDLYSSRPAVRALPSKQMFEHMLKRHDVLFVYVGGASPLKVSTFYHTFFLRPQILQITHKMPKPWIWTKWL